ncbi:hypothetical protein EZV62_010455 [Acer yangbiense]|uniref:Uncharacterized protein n=1 Tax=Acer yangbiense TaxID=1000413 RepID=A0A5C7I2K8_9ROSI|nr:hypothetical protein EZV62_010455 [Acer yangbiense]
MEMKKISCVVLIAAASMSAAMAVETINSAAPAPGPNTADSGAAAAPFLGPWLEPPLCRSSPTTCSKLLRLWIAVVTGANKGIGLEICRQLSSNDVMVNNAGVSGIADAEAMINEILGAKADMAKQVLKQTTGETDHEVCLRTNYYGTKQVTQAFIPLLLQSHSPRIVNVSSTLGQLQFLSNEKAKEVRSNVDDQTEEKIDQVVKRFLEDAKEGLLENNGWPVNFSAYVVSKAVLNAYTRILAKKIPKISINAVSPGFVKTDLNFNNGELTVEEGARGPVMLALAPDGGPSGLFFDQMELSTF